MDPQRLREIEKKMTRATTNCNTMSSLMVGDDVELLSEAFSQISRCADAVSELAGMLAEEFEGLQRELNRFRDSLGELIDEHERRTS